MLTETTNFREDSLIKSFEFADTERVLRKIIFTTVKDVELVYYTNSKRVIDSLEKLRGSNFVISYSRVEQPTVKGKKKDSETVAENRIVRVKLPKVLIKDLDY